jgi:chitinase
MSPHLIHRAAAVRLSTSVLLFVGLVSCLPTGLPRSPNAPGVVGVAAAASTQQVAYFDQWSIYGEHYYPKTVATSGAASHLSTLIYGFENINPSTLTCFQTIKASGDSESDPNVGDGAGDAWADYQMPFDASISVSGKADTASQRLKGNFNQLRQLKAKYPKLKVLASIGGWTFSKYFSKASATAASRAKLVRSCLDMYIRGNLPTGIQGDPSGGLGAAAGIFDGIDIDWEYPGSQGHLGNLRSAADSANYTALLAEFRRQLTVLGAAAKKPYILTAAVPSGPAEVSPIQVSSIAKSLDWANLMSYDMHGEWEGNGPTNFQAPLLPSRNDPAAASHLTVDESVRNWLSKGMPAKKLVLGVPAYWRGWRGASAGSRAGLYQRAAGPSPAFPLTQSAGVASYKELLSSGALAALHYDATTESPWAYDGTTFYTGDTPQSAQNKAVYARQKGLLGVMMFSLESDDAHASLVKSISSGLRR